MEPDAALLAELERKASGAYVHWAKGIEAAYCGLCRLATEARSAERRTQAHRAALQAEERIRQALAELDASGRISAELRTAPLPDTDLDG